MTKMINVDIEKCTGCGACELVCSFKHHGEFNPLRARIHKTVYPEEAIAIPVLCRQCEDPWCARICPAGAITKGKDALSGATVVTVSEEKCVGCKMCMLACPYGAIAVGESGVAEKCDLCNGVPQCVKFCARGALSFDDMEQGILDRQQKVAATLRTAYLQEA
ncbi:MAG: 4Fe-4S dicluster domain-containing protein [Thermoleophilia bacterium]